MKLERPTNHLGRCFLGLIPRHGQRTVTLLELTKVRNSTIPAVVANWDELARAIFLELFQSKQLGEGS